MSQPKLARHAHEGYQASQRRPSWVRWFVADAPGRPRESSRLERKCLGRRPRSSPRTLGRRVYCSPSVRRSSRQNTDCTCRSCQTTSLRHRDRAAHGRRGQHAHDDGQPNPSALGPPDADERLALGGEPRWLARTALPQRPRPGRAAARQAISGARCEGSSLKSG